MRRVSLAFEAPEAGMPRGSKTASDAGAGSRERLPLSEPCSGLAGIKLRPEGGLCLISTVNDRRVDFRKMVSRLDQAWIEPAGWSGLPAERDNAQLKLLTQRRKLTEKSWTNGKAKPFVTLMKGGGSGSTTPAHAMQRVTVLVHLLALP
jgi:hypothetical protein